MTRSIVRAALAALAVPFVLAGCAPEGRPLARVGSQTLTSTDLFDAVRGNEMQYAGAPAEAKRVLLDDLVRREALLEAARRRGSDTTAVARNFLTDLRDRQTLEALYARLAPQDVGVSDAETRRFYRNASTRAAVRLIYAVDRSFLSAALDALGRGEPFADVADRFNMPGVVPAGGLLPQMVSPGQLMSPLDDALRTLPVGEIGGPYETPQGTFLMTIDHREPAEQPDFETSQSQLAEMIRQRKVRQTMSEAIARMRDAYHVEVSPDGPAQLFRLLTPARIGEGLVPPLSLADSMLVLGRWDGGTYTVGEAFDEMRRPDVSKPAASMTPAIRQWIESRLVTRAARAEAARRHLAEEPALARRVRAEFERFLLNNEYEALVAGIPRPDEAALRAAWEGLKQQYPQVTRANVQWVVVPDSAAAAALSMHGGHGGGTLADAVRMAGLGAVVHREALAYPIHDLRSEWVALRETFARMQPGEWAGPERLAEGWKFLQLVDKEQAPVAFDALPPDLRMNLEGSLWQGARDRRLQQYTDSLLTFLQPEVFADRLRRVPWPPPRVADVGR